jgi:hypothetical protein
MKTITRKSIRSLWPLVPGVLLLGIALLYSVFVVSLPYQDPTPEMELEWRAQAKIAEWIWSLGATALAIGVVLVILLAVLRRMKSRPRTPE